MLFYAQTLPLAALFSTLVTGRPFDSEGSRNVVARAKSYAVVNVGGDSTTETPPMATSVVETTTTVEVVLPGKTITREVTATVVPAPPPPPPAPTTPSSSSSSVTKSVSTLSVSSTSISASSTRGPSAPPVATSTVSMSVPSNSTSTTIETPKPIFITVTVPENDGPTEYYDNGQWHTSYRIKTFEVAATQLPAA